jgi:hypothetical protein
MERKYSSKWLGIVNYTNYNMMSLSALAKISFQYNEEDVFGGLYPWKILPT